LVVGFHSYSFFVLKFFKRKKEKKESRFLNREFQISQVFKIKYYPQGGDFILNPQGLNLAF